jgi:flagellar FliL protein
MVNQTNEPPGGNVADDLLEEIEDTEDDNIDSAEASSGKKSLLGKLLSKKMLLIGGLSLLAIGLIAGGAVFFLGGDDDPTAIESNLSEEDVKASLEKKPEIVFEDLVVLEPFERIRMKGNSAMGMISVIISLELTDHRYRKQVYTMEDRLRKIVTGQIREMTWLELRNPEGKIRLKYELLKRMNSVFPKVTVRNIYFTNFLMQ